MYGRRAVLRLLVGSALLCLPAAVGARPHAGHAAAGTPWQPGVSAAHGQSFMPMVGAAHGQSFVPLPETGLPAPAGVQPSRVRECHSAAPAFYDSFQEPILDRSLWYAIPRRLAPPHDPRPPGPGLRRLFWGARRCQASQRRRGSPRRTLRLQLLYVL